MEKTEKEIEIAYSVARRVAAAFLNRVNAELYRPHMTLEDFVQEGVLGWLEGKDIYLSIVTAYRKESPVTWWMRKKGDKEPAYIPIEDDSKVEDTADHIGEIERHLDAEKILKRIEKIEDDNKRFAVYAKLYFGMSLREIADVLESTHETIRKMINAEINKIKEEFAK